MEIVWNLIKSMLIFIFSYDIARFVIWLCKLIGYNGIF